MSPSEGARRRRLGSGQNPAGTILRPSRRSRRRNGSPYIRAASLAWPRAVSTREPAARLGIQQPPLSQQIRALETELELQLFRRKPRGVELTAAGEAFLAEARIVLERAEHAVLAARRAARGEAGRLGLGFTSSASFHPLVPRVIRDFRETSPLVSLTLEEAGTAELVDGLRAERIDAAFVRSPIGTAADLTVHPLLEEEMLAALPSGHHLAGAAKSRLALDALESETFILYRRPLGPGL